MSIQTIFLFMAAFFVRGGKIAGAIVCFGLVVSTSDIVRCRGRSRN
jgi:hypothetical protein